MIVVHCSRTGSSRAYAESLAARLGCRCLPVGDDVPDGEQIVFVGWLRSSFIMGLNRVDAGRLRAVCVVGMIPGSEFESRRRRIADRSSIVVPMFYLRGWMKPESLGPIDRASVLLGAALVKLRGLDSDDRRRMFEAMTEGGSFYDESALAPVVGFCSQREREGSPARIRTRVPGSKGQDD